MAMNWLYENRQGVGVLELRGYLGDIVLARFSGAIGWALGHCAGPVVIDLTSLQGCSTSSKAALGGAAGVPRPTAGSSRCAARTAPPPSTSGTASRSRSPCGATTTLP